jgi:S-adenosylmethionine hydrolase
MPIPRLITLLTDFGLNDVYVGVMKGVIAQVNPVLKVIDLNHQIPPQNLVSAQFNLLNAYPYFPTGTVHVVVVDPGVGSSRRAIAVELTDGFLVGPDNGVFTGLLSQRSVRQVVELTNSHYWRQGEPSNTFHGRDIFAPVGAHLASGVALTDLGPIIDPASLTTSPIPAYRTSARGLIGKVQHIDRFGNVITNIPGKALPETAWSVAIGKRLIPSGRTYGDVPPGQPIALIGSHGWVEISVNGGDAHFQLRLKWEDEVEVIGL